MGIAEKIEIDAKIENLDQVLGFVDTFLEKCDCPMKVQMQLDIAVEEIFVNIAHYAYDSEIGQAEIRIEKEESGQIKVTFIDSGKPFDPLQKEDPDVTLSVDKRPIGGLGIFMVKKSMDDMQYVRSDGCNILMIWKKL
ncbi:MAG: ATP-binding protein [Lachnospiraceae bacterium]|nr:ATP-binding protein [Lachnospiraceae bacterium]